jgi:hypothetical protein
MRKNVGAIDRLIRLIIGLIVIAWGIYAENWWGMAGIVPIITGALNWCPLYTILKISTIKRGDNKIKIG